MFFHRTLCVKHNKFNNAELRSSSRRVQWTMLKNDNLLFLTFQTTVNILS